MSKEPTLSGKQLLKILGRLGFETVRIKGSHYFVRHADGRSTVVPVHSNEDVGKGLFRKILRDCDFSVDEIRELI